MDKQEETKISKLLLKLQGHICAISINGQKDIILTSKRTGTAIAKSNQRQLSMMASRGLIQYKGHDIALTAEARLFLARQKAQTEPFLSQHQAIETAYISQRQAQTPLMRNLDESPLSGLYRRKTKQGAPFLSSEEFEAGERLRRDFTFGALMPSVTMRWAEKSGGKHKAAPNDMSDEIFAARQRVNKALKAIGPDLGSVLIDVCCFLKGMETIEKERQWPARSAKIVLKTALIALDRHYNPENRSIPSQYHAIRSMEIYA